MTNVPDREENNVSAWRSGRGRFASTGRTDAPARLPADPVSNGRPSEYISPVGAPGFLRSVEPDEIPEPASQPLAAVPRRKPFQLSDITGYFRRLPPFATMVVGPVMATAVYLFGFATPLYEAQSVIAITKSSDAGSAGSAGLLGGMEKPSNLAEVFRADEYIKSQALMDSLEAELGLVTEFSSNAIDPVRRLRTIPLLSVSKRMQFDRFVESSIDVQSGLLKLYVRAPDEEQAISISKAVLRNAEIQVSHLGEQLFENRESLAAKMRLTAERQVSEAQAALVALQLKYQEVDPRFRIESIYAQIKDLEDEVQRLQSEIEVAKISGVRNKTRTDTLIEMEASLRQQISQKRSQLVAANSPTGTPLNNLLIEYELASLNVEMAREAVETAIEAQAETVQQAALNRSLFQIVVPPRTAQTAIYPKTPGVLALVFVICLAIYGAFHAIRENRN